MSVSITLGTSSLEVTAYPSASNSPELIPKKKICGVFPIKFQERQVGDTDWTYPYDTITKVRIHVVDGNVFDVELQSVLDQPTWSDGTLAGLNQAISDINAWLPSGGSSPVQYIVATGGTITQVDDYKIHTLTEDDDFIVLSNDGNYTATVLGVGGGGGGGRSGSPNGLGCAGGGGGEAYEITFIPAVQSYPTVIGVGGELDYNGGNTTFNGVTWLGGGAGAGLAQDGHNGGNGGGGGGAFVGGLPKNGGTGTFNGGKGSYDPSGNDSTLKGGGGAGAGANGVDATITVAGNGGIGFLSTVDGNYYGGGGGGGANVSGTPGVGGLGGGGNGALDANGEVGAPNTGGGGGAGGILNINPSGGSGVVKIKYFSPGTINYITEVILENNS